MTIPQSAAQGHALAQSEQTEVYARQAMGYTVYGPLSGSQADITLTPTYSGYDLSVDVDKNGQWNNAAGDTYLQLYQNAGQTWLRVNGKLVAIPPSAREAANVLYQKCTEYTSDAVLTTQEVNDLTTRALTLRDQAVAAQHR